MKKRRSPHVLGRTRITLILSSIVALLLATACKRPLPPTLPVLDNSASGSADTISARNAGGLTQIARWGKGVISAVEYSPDGKWLAIASSVGIYIYDAATLAEARFIDTGFWVACIAFTPDGEILAAGGRHHSAVWLWQVSDGTMLHTLEGHTRGVTSLAFAPDGKVLTSGASDDTVRLWDVSNGELLNTIVLNPSSCPHAGCGITHVAFSPDGQILASGMVFGDAVQLWRASDGALLQDLEGSEYDTEVAFMPEGKTVISWSLGGEVHVWQVGDGALLRTLKKPVGVSVAVAPNGESLASGEGDAYKEQVVRLWQVSDGALLREMEGHTRKIIDIAFAPDGQILASGSQDGTVRVWRASDGMLLHILEGYTACGVTQECGFTSVAFAPDSRIVASGEWSGTVQLRQIDDGTLLWTRQQTWVVIAVAFSSDGEILASASGQGDNKVRLWRVSDGVLLHVLEHPEVVGAIAFSPDGQLLASGLYNNTIQVWQTTDGALSLTLEHPETLPKAVQSVAFAPDGQTLASSIGREIRVWRVSDGKVLRVLESTEFVSDLSFTPDGKALVLTSENAVRVWRMDDGATSEYTLEALCEHECSELSMRSAVFSPNWDLLAAGSTDGTIGLWRMSDGELIHALKGHTGNVNSLAFSPDGQLLTSSSADGTVRLWRVAELEE